MASCIARRTLFALPNRGFKSVYSTSNSGRRSLHASPVALKKKAKVEIEELFSDDLEDDLLSSPVTAPPTPSPPAPAESSTTQQPTPTKRLNTAARHTRFEDLYKKVLPYLNPNLKELRKLPPIRHAAMTHLVDLAQNEAELRRVIELAPKWKDANRHKQDNDGLGEQWGELVVSRAESLTCPNLALEMFSNHAKYAVPLSLPAARHLLHALHTKHSLEQVMTAVALYQVYNLTPIAKDLVSLGLVCRALAGRIYPAQPPPSPKSDSAESPKVKTLKPKTLQASTQVFQALIISLRKLVSSTDPTLYSVSHHARTRALTPKFAGRQERAQKGVAALEKEKTWLKWCLTGIESRLRKTEDSVGWLTEWRVAAGHIKA